MSIATFLPVRVRLVNSTLGRASSMAPSAAEADNGVGQHFCSIAEGNLLHVRHLLQMQIDQEKTPIESKRRSRGS
jgi:hypothetical protein